jgi:DNA (cytosine-5)-methyltransferase 1
MHKVPTVVDLFCGAGGLSSGFSEVGCEVVGGIDNWAPACASFQANEPQAIVRCGDIQQMNPDEFREAIGRNIDIIVGGPSCQGFSTSSGLSRNGRQSNDPRNSLFRDFVRFVDALKPSWIVMENVTGLLLFNKGVVAKAILEEFAHIGYSVVPMILLAADFGVPQLRRRLFFVGNRTGQTISFPRPIHGDPDLWRNFALPFAHLSRIGNKSTSGSVLEHVSIADACSDLPNIEAADGFLDGPYPTPAKTAFQRRMRKKSRKLTMHRSSGLSKLDMECIRHVRQGENWRSLPDSIRNKRFAKIRSYDATTMFKRGFWDKPSHTITTKSNDATAGAFIHPLQDRTFSLREAARLQAFPDRFLFHGTDSQIRTLIGNSVPPLLGEAICRAIAPEIFDAAGVPFTGSNGEIERFEFSVRPPADNLINLMSHDTDQLQLNLLSALD